MKRITENLKNVCGVYKIVNLINGKVYIGSSKNLRSRLREHRSLLRHNKHHNSHLQNSWNKYGEVNFDYCIIEVCREEEQYSREQYYIDMFHPEYNIAEQVLLPSYAEETRNKHSETKKKLYAEGFLIPNGRKKIYMYSLDGTFVRGFDSEHDAVKTMGFSRTSIQRSLNGKYQRCHDYIFKYTYTPTITPYKKKKKDNGFLEKKIRVYNDSEEYLFNSAKECCAFFEVHPVYVRDAIKKHRHFKRKYMIEYMCPVME